MDRDQIERGKRRVRDRLTGPLGREEGPRRLRKPRNVRTEDHEAMLGALEARLSYMSAEALSTLARAVEHGATGRNRNVWPDMASVLAWARTIEAPPASFSPMIRRYMKSAAGRAAWDESPFVAASLLRYLRRVGAPSGEASWRAIRADADEMRGRHRDASRGLMGPRSAQIVSAWEEQRGLVETLVFAGPEAEAEIAALEAETGEGVSA